MQQPCFQKSASVHCAKMQQINCGNNAADQLSTKMINATGIGGNLFLLKFWIFKVGTGVYIPFGADHYLKNQFGEVLGEGMAVILVAFVLLNVAVSCSSDCGSWILWELYNCPSTIFLHELNLISRAETEVLGLSFLHSKGSLVLHLEESLKLQPLLDLSEQHRGINMLIAMALERIKSRMKSMVRRRPVPTLTSMAKGTPFQLQTVESHIQSDKKKFEWSLHYAGFVKELPKSWDEVATLFSGGTRKEEQIPSMIIIKKGVLNNAQSLMLQIQSLQKMQISLPLSKFGLLRALLFIFRPCSTKARECLLAAAIKSYARSVHLWSKLANALFLMSGHRNARKSKQIPWLLDCLKLGTLQMNYTLNTSSWSLFLLKSEKCLSSIPSLRTRGRICHDLLDHEGHKSLLQWYY